MKSTCIALSLCIISHAPVYAGTNIPYAIIFSPAVKIFNYEEFDQSDTSLDKETGYLPGLITSVAFNHIEYYTFALNIEYYQGTIDYDGQFQNGRPLKTLTDTKLLAFAARISRTVEANKIFEIFLGLENNTWERNILASSRSKSLLEEYTWTEIQVGISIPFFHKANQFDIELSTFYTINPKIKVESLTPSIDTVSIGLGSKPGFKATALWTTRLQEHQFIGFSGSYKYWQFGRSDRVTIRTNDNTITITEPRSVSKMFSLQLYFKVEF